MSQSKDFSQLGPSKQARLNPGQSDFPSVYLNDEDFEQAALRFSVGPSEIVDVLGATALMGHFPGKWVTLSPRALNPA